MAGDAPAPRWPWRGAAIPAIVVAPALAWSVGWLLGDRFLWSQFLAWVPAALLAVWYAALGAGLALRRRRLTCSGRPAALSAVLALAFLGRALAIDNRPLVKRTPDAQTAEPLRLLHCNMHWPGRSVAPRVLEFAIARPEDLVVLTEPGWLLLNRRGEALEEAGWRVLRIGNYAVLSRLPILEARVLFRGRGIDVTVVRVDATSRGLGELTMGLVDLPSRLLHPRMKSALDLHELLVELEAPAFDLVVGDFNTTRGSPSLAALFPGMRNAWGDAGRGWGGSFPSWLPLWHIDLLLLGPQIRALDYTLVDIGLTNHRAQIAELAPLARGATARTAHR